jgi:hypothetical protein
VTDPLPNTPVRITVQDLRAARYCLAGVRPWFRRHGLGWQEFLDHGIDADRLRATGDVLVDPVLREAEVREASAPASGSKNINLTEASHGRQ